MRYFISACLLMGIIYAGSGCSGGNQQPDPSHTNTGSDADQYAEGDTLSFRGTLIDTHCYSLDQENIGEDHTLPESGFREDCAQYCANLGYPVAVLVGGKPGNKVWIMRFSSQVFAEYMANEVRVDAEFISNGLAEPFKVEMKTEDGWIQII